MIKLNNKNITYVALADSSNSLKAPKEIWYADSNNSVKLVYRRKDALIEGVDYEKYHWVLTDTGNPFIQVADGYNTDNDAYLETTFKCASVNGDKDIIIGFGGDNSFGYRLFAVGQAVFIDIHKRTSGVLTSKRLSFSYPPYQVCHVFVNSNRYEFNNVAGTYELGNGFDAGIRQNSTQIHTNLYNNDMHYAETKMRVNNVEYDLIPCKLLKPVPKWLDANGIRRQAGECGMIDLVSGKFYGKVNSVGTFTVENYYERKEWLVGDGSAYIDTNIIVNVPTLRYSLEFIHDTTNNAEFLCGSRNSTSNDEYSSAIIIDKVYNNMIRLDAICTPSYPSLLYSNIILNAPNEVHINCRTNSAIVNDSSIAGNRTRFNNSPYTFRIFDVYPKDASTYPTTCTCKMSYFNLNDGTHSLNLIPCTLTMDLPASMDANNIPRTKGTSGMWDLVSDRFYGNVASSGTFKAVNLAEGVDYEVHQWLVADIPIGVAMMSLPINSSTFNCTIEHTGARANLPHLYSNGYIYFTESSNMDMISVWDVNGANIPFSTSVGSLMTIESNEEYFKVNNISITKYGFPILRMVIQSSYNSNNATTTKTSKISVDGIERYIPVKLLKSIPSKYDADGIARQAGECGMYDTVNDLFYGNVASSGSFSVSDDN